MALRVERDAAAEAAARRRPAPVLPEGGPAYLEGVGTLKSYQITGERWGGCELALGAVHGRRLLA